MKTTIRTAIIAITLTLAAAPLLAESYSGRILDAPGSIQRMSSVTFRLNIDDYSTDDEVRDLAAVLDQEGTRSLERTMDGLDYGWLRIGNDLPQPVAVARSFVSDDGGQVLRVVVARDIAFFETWRHTRSRDYPYTILEIRLDEEGRGEGTMIAAARMETNEEGAVEIDSLGWRPIRLIGVRALKS